jgi:hypothetical protein
MLLAWVISLSCKGMDLGSTIPEQRIEVILYERDRSTTRTPVAYLLSHPQDYLLVLSFQSSSTQQA